MVEGTYVEWAEYETALWASLPGLGDRHQGGALQRARASAGHLVRGARMQRALAPMIERNAFIGAATASR